MLPPDEMLAAIGQVVKVLGPLESEDRHRIIQASLVVLKEKSVDVSEVDVHASGGDEAISFLPKVRTWMKQNGLSVEQLQNIFDLSEGSAEVIAAGIPGKSGAERTINSYVLEGLRSLLAVGDVSFDDKAARALCGMFGCYDTNNHSTYMKEKGNKFAGSKDKGWKLTAPGLKFGANLVKEMTQEQEK